MSGPDMSGPEMNEPGKDGADRRAELAEERDFLLRSLEDLEREHDAGDIGDDDYATLRDDYTARAAEVLRAIEGDRPAAEARPRRVSRKALLTSIGVIVFALVGGLVLAKAVGTRGVGGTATGGIGTLRSQLAECQPLAFREPKKGISCYDELLDRSPDNVEALTYRGWAKVRAGDLDAGQKDLDRVVEIDPKFPDVYVFRAVTAKRRGDLPAARAELDTFYSLNPAPGVVSTLQQMGTEYEIEYGLLDPSVQVCFDEAQTALGTGASASTSTTITTTTVAGAGGDALVEVFKCLDKVIAQRPDDVMPLLLRGFLLATSGSPALIPEAASTIDRAVEVAPKDPTARLLRAAFRAENGDKPGAIEDLDALVGLGRPSVLLGLAAPDEIRQSVGG